MYRDVNAMLKQDVATDHDGDNVKAAWCVNIFVLMRC